MSEGVTSLYGATEPDTPHVVILISGGGSNMTAIADQVSAGMIDAEIAAVICNNPEAAGLQKARDRNIPTDVVDHRQFASREDFDRALMASSRHASNVLSLHTWLLGFIWKHTKQIATLLNSDRFYQSRHL